MKNLAIQKYMNQIFMEYSKSYRHYLLLAAAVLALAFSSCQKELTIAPVYPDTNDTVADATPEALSGLFSVAENLQVRFSQGNLQCVGGTWRMAEQQYDFWGDFADEAWDHFGWSTVGTNYGLMTSSADNNYVGDYVEWGSVFGADSPWRTLTADEWIYLRYTRPNAYSLCATGTVQLADGSAVTGCFFLPDDWVLPEGCTFNAELGMLHTDYSRNTYSVADGSWAAMQAAGAVFLPAAGCRHGYSFNSVGTHGRYWTAPSESHYLYYLYFTGRSIDCVNTFGPSYGNCVRLVVDNE